MRMTLIVAGLAALSVAACGQNAEKDAATPGEAASMSPDTPVGPTPGLWRVTTSMTGMPAGASVPPVETCVTSAKFEVPNQGDTATAQGATCTAGEFRREGDAMVGSSTCTLPNGMKTESVSRVSGDFTRAYTMEVTTRMDPAPAPQMAEVKVTMNAERLGDCPAGGAAAPAAGG